MSVLCWDWNVTQDTELLCRDRLQTEGDNRRERETLSNIHIMKYLNN